MIVIFDLDGTVWDSEPGIVGCILTTFEHFGLDVPDRSRAAANLGPPLRSMLAELDMPEGLLDDAVLAYRRCYGSVGVFDARLYDGIVDELDRLLADGHTLATGTSKGEDPTRVMLEHFGLADRFEVVGAASMDGLATTKPEVLGRVLAAIGDPDAGDCVMVGDRHYDVTGAAVHGIRCIGAAWGYGSEQELLAAGAVAIAHSPTDVTALIGQR